MFKNPRTSIAGIGALLVAIGGALGAIFDGDPLTNPDWTAVVAAVTVAVGLIFARDSNKTSEQVGAGK